MSAVRWLLVALLIAGTAALLFHSASGGEAKGGAIKTNDPAYLPNPTPIALEAAESCRPCHEDVVNEWWDSHHRIAYTNPEVQRRSNGFQDLDCLPCHLPRPVLETGLSTRPLERGVRHADGVDCFTCHHDPKAHVMVGRGPLSSAAATAPCQPVSSPLMGEMGLCAPCHNQHKVHEEWRQTSYAVPGEGYRDCNDCHMPIVERTLKDGTKRKGRSHRYPAAHDAGTLKSAATYSVEVGGASTLLVNVKNTGAGHNFPTDERHRAVDVLLTVQLADGRSGSGQLDRYRNPYRQEFNIRNPLREPGARRDYVVELQEAGEAKVHAVRVPAAFNPIRRVEYQESTQIPAGEARSYSVSLPTGAASAHVRVYYRLQPFQSNEEATLLYEKTLRLQ